MSCLFSSVLTLCTRLECADNTAHGARSKSVDGSGSPVDGWNSWTWDASLGFESIADCVELSTHHGGRIGARFLFYDDLVSRSSAGDLQQETQLSLG